MAVGISPLETTQVPRLKCLGCGRTLDVEQEKVSCAACGRTWPVRDGVVRMVDSSHYWGEIPQADARRLMELAERDGWRNAVQHHFAADQDLVRYVLDTQRTSWVSLLGLGPDAVALDIGSGYGTLTHALASQVAEVYSLEAIPERIEFTRIRVAQEGISNVRLVQGNALQLPMPDGSFDLAVANGVLEWVGEWTMEGDPRLVQLRFLSDVYRLLKPNGILVIGIENRISFEAFRGGRDHSGLRWTTLMPRSLASLYLRLDRRPHHRTALNPKRQYRTYTYSEWGYRKLLADSGFRSVSFYWADPGYNRPYALVPLRGPFVREHMLAILDDPAGTSRPGWRQQLKRLWTALGLVRPFVPQFVIIAQKGSQSELPPGQLILRELQTCLPHIPRIQKPTCQLSTWPFNNRNLVRVFESGAAAPTLVIKTSTPTIGSKQAVAAEYRNLSLVHARLSAGTQRSFAVPRPIGSCPLGRLDCTIESSAAGRALWRIVLAHLRRDRIDLIRRELHRCVEASIDLTQTLHGERSMESADARWGELPRGLVPAAAGSLVDDGVISPMAAQEYRDYVQHGDYTAANIFIDPLSGRVTLIDWEDALRGLPPLYDCFALLISLLPILAPRQRRSARRSAEPAQLLDMFFQGGRWTTLARELLLLACDRLSIQPERVWTMFTQSLLLRTHYYRHRGSPHAQLFASSLELAWQRQDEFLLPRREPS